MAARENDLKKLETQVIEALAQHQRVREAMRSFVESDRSGEPFETLAACSLTAWLDAEIPLRFRSLGLYARTVAAHERFHAAIDAVRDARDGDEATAGDERFTREATLLRAELNEWLTLARSAN